HHALPPCLSRVRQHEHGHSSLVADGARGIETGSFRSVHRSVKEGGEEEMTLYANYHSAYSTSQRTVLAPQDSKKAKRGYLNGRRNSASTKKAKALLRRLGL